ncbi:hypothetical protein AB0G15_05830 [Streptosporangium sp. NPDC023825]|uniref:hypothetical protein n=1 Tax=Streptosporangium sp. NPDC023825 TaxID=3154909 RepID=UPI00344927EA
MTENATHWHIATGLTGHGPDGYNEFGTATEVTGSGGLADQVSDELKRCAESAYESATAMRDVAKQAREAGNDGNELDASRDALTEWARSEELDHARMNFDETDKLDAPVYKENPALWPERVLKLVGEMFPLDISRNSRLYVWLCEAGDACEHLSEDDE